MQAQIKTAPYEYFDPIFDGRYEAPVDAEYNLPDYCADIQKILKCRMVPEISSYIISGDTLTCDGVCDIRVLYLDGKGDTVRCCDFTKDFTASIKLKSSEEKAVACVQASIAHLTCRAVSARRVDLHAAICLQVLAVVQKKELITCSLEDETIEKRGESFQAHQAVNAVCHQFTIEDTLPVKNGKPPIETILRRDVSCRVIESRISEERLTVNGTADISFLYTSAVDSNTVEKLSSSIDFSQVIECAGAEESCVCDLRIVTGESSIQPREDDVGEYNSVSVVIKVFLMAFLYKSCEVEIIDDAYSVKAPLELRYSQSVFTQIHGITSETLKKKCSLTVSDDEIQKVLDIWCEQDLVQTICEKAKLNYRVKYTVCMLYMNAQGRILYIEKQFDHNFTTEMENPLIKRADTTWHTDMWEYRIADRNTVEVSVETSVVSTLLSLNTVKYLTSAATDENTKDFDLRPRFLVYYASQGEKLWDIAKGHRAMLSDIRNQNELFDDIVPEPRPIIICNR
ncbi:DUF3794 domain-containing protein [Acutalibacter sp. 1XD8-33]|uniref:DUF3794 domain-containing protein n=1 Tax=Acutalibacter sp. 1XD8-33 TaxID=2320081 RepID=UPI000EA21F23|nr:DUF3794 domain-containing protein [Acutalibacter sp. 1XD8-33]RKJ40423.1 DUF3794 domain-containing protein [Acutalibacter sp. 1XD8-33]